MIQSKKINIIVAIALVFALITSIALVGIGNIHTVKGAVKTTPEYATKIFGSDIISIEIIANEADWQEMIDNATREEYIMVDVVVNETKFYNVGIRPKGNSSLTQVAGSGSDRYSFRLKFDEYIKGQTCFGLDSFVVNNMTGDNTYMKEYVSYELMQEIGVDAPYFGFADIKVNGEGWGLYLAVETYGDSYETRTFGTTEGMMYNVKSMDMGGNKDGNGFDFPQGGMQPPEMGKGGDFPQAGMQPPDIGQGGNFPQGGMQPPDIGQGGNFPQGGMQPPAVGQGDNFPQGGMKRPATGQGGDFPQGGMLPPTMGQGGNIPQGGMQPPINRQGEQTPPSTQAEANSSAPTQPDGQRGGRQMERPNGNFGGPMGGRGSNGGSLEYSTDEISAYSAIFNNVVGKGNEDDFKRVITVLKALSEGEDLETYFDVDQILRYLAAHTIVVNLDSYSSSMAQNYYLFENNGKVTILPWDYNLAWGGFQSGSASSVINFPIDTPVSGVEMSSRPLLEKLFSNTEYLEKYHGYLQELMTNYFADGKWEAKITQLDALISDYVKNDNTAFSTFEEYKKAVEAFKTLGNLRYKSIQGQLDGTVPSTTAEQNANPDKLISAGNLSLSSLGSMMGGGNRGGMGDRGFPQRPVGNMQNSAPNNKNITPDRGEIPSPFGGQRTRATSTNESLLIYSGLFAFVLLATFFVAKQKRSY